MRMRLRSELQGLMSVLLLLLLLLGSLAEEQVGCHALKEEPMMEHELSPHPTCNRKDRCELEEMMSAKPNLQANGNGLLKQVAYIFEDNVNYSLKLFAHDSSPKGGQAFDLSSLLDPTDPSSTTSTSASTFTSASVAHGPQPANRTVAPAIVDIEDYERGTLHSSLMPLNCH